MSEAIKIVSVVRPGGVGSTLLELVQSPRGVLMITNDPSSKTVLQHYFAIETCHAAAFLCRLLFLFYFLATLFGHQAPLYSCGSDADRTALRGGRSVSSGLCQVLVVHRAIDTHAPHACVLRTHSRSSPSAATISLSLIHI